MGVKGAGLKSNGLHKSYINGSPGDHNSAAHKTAHGKGGGATSSDLKANGMMKAYLGGTPAETKSKSAGGQQCAPGKGCKPLTGE